jgi:hypothetical protein
MWLSILFLQAFSGEGFYPLHHSSNPSWVKEAANSIYTIVLHETADTSPSLTNAEIIEYQASACKKPSSIVETLNCQHFSQCSGDTCNFKPYLDRGTAFLTGSGNVIMTAFHVLYPLHQMRLLTWYPGEKTMQQEILSWQPDFVLVDQFGNTVFDTRKERKKARYLNAGSPSLFAASFTRDSPFMLKHDFAEIELPRVLGKGLKISNTRTENLFSVGYPKKVSRQNGFSANGNDIYVSRGKKLNYSESTRKLSQKVRSLSIYLAMQDEPIVASDMDIVPGNSGSPIFNEYGEVIAIASVAVLGPGAMYRGLIYGIPFSMMQEYDLRRYYK